MKRRVRVSAACVSTLLLLLPIRAGAAESLGPRLNALSDEAFALAMDIFDKGLLLSASDASPTASNCANRLTNYVSENLIGTETVTLLALADQMTAAADRRLVVEAAKVAMERQTRRLKGAEGSRNSLKSACGDTFIYLSDMPKVIDVSNRIDEELKRLRTLPEFQ